MANEQLIAAITEEVLRQLGADSGFEGQDGQKIPVGISNRHVHLSQEDIKLLFGRNGQLTKFKDLSQPGQYACEQKVTLVGKGGVIENVRILGPARIKTQVEVSKADTVKLGIEAPLRESGDLAGAAGITLVGPAGSVTLQEGAIIAARHIHMHTQDAAKLGLNDRDYVAVKTIGPRGLTFNNVIIRVSDKFKLEMHIDIDEANAALLKTNDYVVL